MKKNHLLYICFFFLFAVTLQAQRKYTINETWKFSKTQERNNYLKNLDDSAWEVVSIPHTWNDRDVLDDTPGFYRGIGWYRRNVYIDSLAENKTVYIYFEGANQEVDLYVNEQLVGSHKGGYTRFSFDITPYIKSGEFNLFAIKVDNAHNVDIPPLSADFTFFGGIYRDVYLIEKEKIHISPNDYASSGVYITTPLVNNTVAHVEVKSIISNTLAQKSKARIEQTVYSPAGTLVSSQTTSVNLSASGNTDVTSKKILINNPQLWSPETPHLYTLTTRVLDEKGKVVLDEVVENFGLRYFEFDADKGFILNGSPLKLIGTNRHQCYENLGYALRDEMHVQDVLLLKEMGGNFLRVSHYPQDPMIMDLCDKLGIITSVEIPIVNAITESQAFLDNSLVMAKEMVMQDFNRPSVVIWAYMNEVMLRPPFRGDRHKEYCIEVNRHARAIDSLLRAEDPARYTMLPFHGSVSAYADAGLFEVAQIIGWNLYQGWYGGVFREFDGFMDKFHKDYPDKPTIITEYGADVDPRLHSFHPQRFDYTAEYANLYHDHYLKAIMDRPYIAGANIWNLNDFHSEPRGNAVPHINNKGIMGLDRKPKDTYLLYKAFLSKEPVVLIGSREWKIRGGVETGNGQCTQTLRVYSNLSQVSVYQNGKLVKENIPVNNFFAEVNIPFVDGKNLITAEGKQGGTLIQDYYECDFSLVPARFENGKGIPDKGMNIMLGSLRYFEDDKSGSIWIPEQEYQPGGWGYVGGKAFNPSRLPASDLNILGTDIDPVFQTQRENIESFKFDVANGRYAIYFYWAELIPQQQKEALAYNLGNDAKYDAPSARSFHLKLNGKYEFKNFDIAAQIGSERAIIKKIETNVVDGKGISIDFEPVTGSPILNAVRIIKLD